MALAIDYGFNIGIASAILTVTIIVFSEVIPKSIAASFSERIAFLVYPVIRFFVILFKPITFLLNKFTGYITRALSKGEVEDVSVSKDELRAIIDIEIGRASCRERVLMLVVDASLTKKKTR